MKLTLVCARSKTEGEATIVADKLTKPAGWDVYSAVVDGSPEQFLVCGECMRTLTDATEESRVLVEQGWLMGASPNSVFDRRIRKA